MIKSKNRETTHWYGVTVASKHHGGGLQAIVENETIQSEKKPKDEFFKTDLRAFKRRYFESLEEAEKIRDILNSLDITIERIRNSVTQGECRVFINGIYIINFGDEIVLVPHDADMENFYGANIGGWMSNKADSGFTLGLIWHPLNHIYHYDEMVCRILGIETENWIEG